VFRHPCAVALLSITACQDYGFNRKGEAEAAGSPDTAETELDVPDEPGPSDTRDTGPEDPDPFCDVDPPPEQTVTVNDACVESAAAGTFTPVVEWSASTFSTHPAYVNVISTPSVGDVNGDGQPDIVAVFYQGSGYRGSPSVLRVLDGASGTEHWSLLGTLGAINGTSGNALADVDGDGDVELFVCTTGRDLLAIDHTGRELWLASGVCASGEDKPSVHDLDGDGDGEIVVGASWVDHTGTLLASGPHGRGGVTIYGAASFAADVDGDGALEILAGNAVYEADGSVLWSSGNPDGQAALGDLEGDGTPDLIVTTPAGMYRYEADTGVLVWGPMPFTGGAYGGPPTIADFDGDGEEEFGVAGLNSYVVYEGDASELWKMPTTEGSIAITGSAVFDFEGDGAAEVVYADHETLWVFSGVDGTVKLEWTDHSSGTVSELPVVADVDGDNQAEIVLASNTLLGSYSGITVFGDQDGSWMGAAPIWNQHAFHRSHIADDGSLPATYTPSWQDHRSFRSGSPEGLPTAGIPDLAIGEVDICTDTCPLGEVTVWVAIENRGLAAVRESPVQVDRASTDPSITAVSLDSGEMTWIGPLTLTEDDFDLQVTVDGVGGSDTSNDAVTVAWPCE